MTNETHDATADDSYESEVDVPGLDEPVTRTVERTDKGISVKATITRGTEVRDQEKIELKSKDEELTTAVEQMDDLIYNHLPRWGKDLREFDPNENEPESDE